MPTSELLENRFAAECPGAFFLDADNVASLTEYLHARHFLSSGETLSQIARAGEGNMNLTLRVKTSARRFIIKQSRPWVEKYPQLAAPWDRVLHEARFYELTLEVPAVAERMPRVLAVDPISRVILLEDLGEAGDFSSLYSGDRLSESAPAILADYLSGLHSLACDASTRLSLTNRELRRLNHAHIFEIPFLAENGLDLDAITPGLADAAAFLKKDPACLRRMTELGQRYLADGPILLHGDFYPGSWLHSEKGLRVIDPEFGHFGCAEFEVGVFQAHWILTGHTSGEWQKFRDRYQSPPGFDARLMDQFTGAEIIRRLIGYAQLPLVADLTRKNAWLSQAASLAFS